MRDIPTGIRLREATRRRLGATLGVWRWGEPPKATEARGVAGGGPLGPLPPDREDVSWDDDVALLADRRPNRRVRYLPGVTLCQNRRPSGPHFAFIELHPGVSHEALSAWGRRVSCVYCAGNVPPSALHLGHLETRDLWDTPSGLLEVGSFYWEKRARTETPVSREAIAWDTNLARDSSLVVVLPDGMKWDVLSSLDGEEEGAGWTVDGLLPAITTTPAVESESWTGRIVNGELVVVVE